MARVNPLLKPHAVPSDAQVAIVSPASTPQADRVELGLEALRALGYAPQKAEHILTRGPLYFAGTPQMRLSDLHHAFADDQVRAIFSTRGGYGANYLLDGLDLDLIAESAKPLIGYSDLTALHLWLLAVSPSLRARVAKTAGHCCGYCRTPERVAGFRLTIEHTIPKPEEERRLKRTFGWPAMRAMNSRARVSEVAIS